jgi:hypothetical protein
MCHMKTTLKKCVTSDNVTHQKRSYHLSISKKNRQVFDIIDWINEGGGDVSDALCKHIIRDYNRIRDEMRYERLLEQGRVESLE